MSIVMNWFPSIRSVTAAMLVLVVAASASGQVLLSPPLQEKKDKLNDQPSRASKVDSETVKVTLYPRTQADPLLRYRLWPAPEDQDPRLATPIVSRAVILVLQTPEDSVRQLEEGYGAWRELPLSDFPVEKARPLLARFEFSMGELKRIENMMGLNYDLGMERMTTNQRIRTWLPEFQEMRQLARVLALRIRLAMAEKRWSDAVNDLRVGIRLAEVAGHSTDLLISRLVGIAIHGVMMEEVALMMQQPDAPSLYWALAAIPMERLYEMRSALEFESAIVSHIGMVSDLKQLPDAPMGGFAAKARLEMIADQLNVLINDNGFRSNDLENAVNTALLSGAYMATMIEPSRKTLAESEQWGDRIDELSDPEILLRAADLSLRRTRDRWLMWSTLPEQDMEEYSDEREAAFRLDGSKLDVGQVLSHMLSPAVEAAVSAVRRARQQHNQLMTLEALRIHAAEHGQLPESLNALRPVPARRDSIARAPFRYIRTRPDRAVLTRAERFAGDKETVMEISLEQLK